jgi:hypothetical protein
MSFFAGNAKNVLIKKQSDKDTPVTDWTGALNLRVYEWGKESVRAISELNESDASTQQSGSHVTAITPSVSFGIYGRPSELDFLAEALLGGNDDSATSSPTSHTAFPDVDTPYYSILEVLPYGSTRFDGCRLASVQFTGTDEGQTELRVTGISWVVLGVLHGVTAPDPLPAVKDELPFIFAEAAISYDGSHPGTTSAFTVTVNRNTTRAQGDSGFRALDAVNGKLQVDGSLTRYTADDTIMRLVDTGSTTGTDITSDIGTESASILFTRGSGSTLRSFLIALTEISYESREEALELDGKPYKEVLGFRTQPQPDIADHLSIVTVNAKATPSS